LLAADRVLFGVTRSTRDFPSAFFIQRLSLKSALGAAFEIFSCGMLIHFQVSYAHYG